MTLEAEPLPEINFQGRRIFLRAAGRREIRCSQHGPHAALQQTSIRGPAHKKQGNISESSVISLLYSNAIDFQNVYFAKISSIAAGLNEASAGWSVRALTISHPFRLFTAFFGIGRKPKSR